MACTVGAARRFGGGALGRTAAAFAAGVAVGSVAAFAVVGVVATTLHPGRVWLVAAAAIALAAAAADTLGLRVRPQVPLQVPEAWRRTLPLPIAVFLYGLLLGTGVATYVPAMAAWALIVLSLGLGSLTPALVIGLFLAAGKAAPVVGMALSGRPAPEAELLAERPGLLRGARTGAAVLLAFGAAAALAGPARSDVIARPAEDPSVAGTDLAWQQPGVGGFLVRRGAAPAPLPGSDPAIGGSHIAWHDGGEIVVADRTTLAPVVQETVAGVQKLAVDDRWLAYRQGFANGSTRLVVQSLDDPSRTRKAASARSPAQVGRPSLSGDLLVYHVAQGRSSWISSLDLSTGKRRRLRSASDHQLLHPSSRSGQLLYVDVTRCAQQLRLGRLTPGHDRVLFSLPPLAGQDAGRERGHTEQGSRVPCRGHPRPTRTMLWTTALTSRYAYVTTLRRDASGAATPSLVRLTLPQ